MANLTPDQAHFLLHNVYLATLKTESRTTKKILEAVPPDKASYQPDSCAKSAIELVRHIAVAENFFLEAPINGAFNPGAVKIPDGVNTPGEVASWYEQTYAKNFDALTKLSGEQLAKIVDFRGMFQQRRPLSPVRLEPHHSPPRPAVHLSPPHGQQSPSHLRRKLRLRPSQKSRPSPRVIHT